MKQMQRVISVLFVSFVSFCARGAKIHSEAISESSIATSENAGGTSGFQLPPAGSYIAIRGLKEGRWLKIEGCQVGHSWGGNDNLADEARAERFKLVGTGSGTHALHNTEWSRYLIMKGGSLQVSEVLSEFEWARLPAGGLFTLQGTENGHAIWSAHNERFIINEGGIKVGPVEARTAAFGTGASTGGSGTGGTGVRKYDFRILQQTYTRPCPSLHTSHGASCKAYIIGKTIGLYNPYHERYIRVKEGGWADASAVIPRHTFPGWEYLFAPSLPNGWTWERFEVVDAGNGNIALHNIEHNRFLAMDAQGFIRAGGLRDAGEPNCDASGGEHFTLVGDLVAYGDQNVALYNPHFQHFVKMDDSAQLVVLGPLGSDQLQSSNTWEKFLVQEESYQKDDCPYLYFPKGASCKPWLIFQKVSFYNPWHQRFMKMINTDSADLVTTHQQGADDLCDSCDDERFRVVDVGMGMLGLYNEKFGRYVQMTDTQKMRSTHVMAKADLQGAWQWEKFQVVDLGNGKIGLHSGYFNRFVAMDYQTVIATAQHYNWNSPPTGDWPRFTVTYSGYGDHWTPEPWESFTDQSCKGSPYTYDECGGNCNGWSQITQAECQEKCENDDMPAGCQQDQTCMGAVYYPSNGWCHLYSICPETESYVGAVAIRRKVSPFNFLEVHSTVTKQIALRGEMAEKDGLEKLQELAVSLPIALVNLTNYSGLISSGKNMTHLDIAYRFGNYSKDLELLYDKTAGFYGALHEVMGEDANKYCPLKDWTHIEQCIRIASCLIEPAVEAGKLPIAFLVAIMEQLASFDIIWNMLTEALIKESNINQTAPGQFLPPKYVCDMFEKLDATSLAVPSMIQENQEKKEMDTAAVRSAFSTSAALNKATRESHQILSSLTSSDNVSYSVVKRWAETWYPVCVRMKCDHTNYLDIVLASYKQTLLFMKSGALSHLKAEIINRATLQRRFQSHLSEHPVLVQLWRREAQASSLEAAHAYGLAGNKAVKRVLKKFLESPGGLPKMMKLVDRVEFEKWQRTKAEADAEAHGEATPLRQVSNQSAHLALLSTRSEGVWDFFVNMVKCFGKWSLWYTQGYYKNLGSYGSVSFGMITGTTGAFESLVKELVPPQAFVSVWAAIGVGLTISGGKLPSVWVGLSASLSASLGCANNNYAVQVAISVGTMAAGVMPLPSHPMCPMGGWWHGIQCFHAIGGTFTLLCCKFDLASGNNNCR